VIDEKYGIFVSAGAGPSPDGTRAHPYPSFTLGLPAAKQAGKRVYACAGATNYDEHVLVDGAASATTDGVNVYGGFDCAAWTYAASKKPKIAPSTAGFGLQFLALKLGMTWEDVEFDSVDAGTGGSKVRATTSLLASGSTNVIFRRSIFRAGKALAGQGGSSPTSLQTQPPNGADSNGTMGAGATTNVCNNSGNSVGGAAGPTINTNGSAGTPSISPVNPNGYTGAGGDYTSQSCSGTAGYNGSYGKGGAGGQLLTTYGDFLGESGWNSNLTAPSGSVGGTGQGGGGASSQVIGTAYWGGGGAPGGCGGDGAPGGDLGGSSFAVLLYSSSATFEQTTFTAGDAGAGGAGGTGAKGQLGPVRGGHSGGAQTSCFEGGIGGHGGSGGGGGGGNGGLSVGIGWRGTAPTVDGSQVTDASALSGFTLGVPGAPGAKGSGGQPVTNGASAGSDGATGTPGVAKAVMQL
jgi:hypothetical protein